MIDPHAFDRIRINEVLSEYKKTFYLRALRFAELIIVITISRFSW